MVLLSGNLPVVQDAEHNINVLHRQLKQAIRMRDCHCAVNMFLILTMKGQSVSKGRGSWYQNRRKMYMTAVDLAQGEAV